MGSSTRRFVVLLLVALMLVPAAPAGSEADPEIDDPTGDAVDDTGSEVAWADIDKAWMAHEDDALVFDILVADLGDASRSDSQDDSGTWNFLFNHTGTTWRLRAQWSEGSLVGDALADGAQQGAAEVDATIIDDEVVHLVWTNFRDFMDLNVTLVELYAYTNANFALGTNKVDCHGTDVVDCAPDSDFGETFELLGPLAARDLEIEVSPTNATADPGDLLSFDISVANPTNRTMNLTLSASGPADLAWTIGTPNASLPAGASMQTDLDVEVDANARGNTTHTLTLTVAVEGDGQATREIDIFVVQPPEPPDPYGFDIEVDPGQGTVHPGQTAEYTITVTNHGARGDVIQLELQADDDWGRLSTQELDLDAGATGEATLTVTVPPDAGEGQVSHTVAATSTGNASHTGDVFVLTNVEFRSGLYETLDRQFKELGLGGLIPALVLLAFVLVVVVLLVIRIRGPGRVVDVEEAEWSDEAEEADETPEDGD